MKLVGRMRHKFVSLGFMAALLTFVLCVKTYGQEAISADASTPTEISDDRIEALIGELTSHPWDGPKNETSPIHWQFHLTPPMASILRAGRGAQTLLIRYLGDPGTRDQIIFLLGGVGDENAIGPIITAMADKDEMRFDESARKVNLSANLALTNITTAEVIWHRGGGMPIQRCPDDPKSCWTTWWQENREHLRIPRANEGRRYVNFPNYGVYEQRNPD